MNKVFAYIKANFPSDRNTILRECKSYSIITIALCLYAFSLVAFIINSDIVGGGVNGISTLLYYITSKTIPVGISSFVINTVLLLIGIKILGKSFGFKTFFGIVMMSVFIEMWQGILVEPILADDKFLSAVIGGGLAGIAIGMSFNYGGSTGGTDIIALIVAKYRNISPGRVILYCDVFIMIASFFVFYCFLDHSAVEAFRIVLYAFVVMISITYTIDLVVLGSQSSVQMLINTKKSDEIAEVINLEIGRGCTYLHAQRHYTGEEAEVVLAVVRKYQLQSLLRRIKAIDPEAFISVTSAMGVYGRGFDGIK